jgi:cellulose synthase/poly-beta-1,6-N-acetylglucosamine synthase-like glycosyltransferase
VIAFTDSDCIPAPDWIEKAVEGLETLPAAGVVGGRIERFGRRPERLSLPEIYDATFFMRQDAYVTRSGFAVTANLATRTEVFAKVGLFDPSLKSGGDAEWGRRAIRHGVRFRYEPGVVVSHPSLPTVAALLRKSRRVVGGHVQSRIRHGYPLHALGRDVTGELRGIARRWTRVRAVPPPLTPSRQAGMWALIALAQVTRALERVRLFAGGRPRRR